MKKKIIVQGRPFTFGLSGNRTFTTNFIQHLASRLPEITFEILVPKPIQIKDFNLPSNVYFHYLEPQNSDFSDPMAVSQWENEEIAKYMKSQNSDELMFFLSTHHSLPLEKLNIKEYVIVHDIHLWSEPDANWSTARKQAFEINKKSVANADKIFTVSDFTNNEIHKFFNPTVPVVSIYEDVNEYYKSSPPLDLDVLKKFNVEKDNFFLYIGSFEARKNVDSLLIAYQKYLEKSNEKKDLLIIGSHTNRSREVVSLNLGHNIKQFDTASIEEIYLLYKCAYAFVYPSTYEGFGLQIVEANNAGCPLLASDIDIFHEVGQESILYFNPRNIDNIVDSLIKLENESDTRQIMIEKGFKNAKRYGWEKTVSIFINNMT